MASFDERLTQILNGYANVLGIRGHTKCPET